MRGEVFQHGGWCRVALCFGVLMGLWCSAAFGAKVKQDRFVFCVKTAKDDWTVQKYRPLIDLHAGLIVEQVGYEGTRLDQVLMKRYDPVVQVTFDYKFDESGKLTELHGFVRRWGRWVCEANLYPLAVGETGPLRVKYRGGMDGTEIFDPDDGPRFEPLLKAVAVYRTVNEIPCAGMLQEAEKMNATQE